MQSTLRSGVESCCDRCLKSETLAFPHPHRRKALYLVPNNLSPASPRPGMMYPASLRWESMAAV